MTPMADEPVETATSTTGSTGGGRRAEPRDPLLVVEDLQKHFPIRRGVFRTVRGHVRAVDGISFTIPRGSTMALVGESGCGKTTAARAILRLEEPTGGRVVFDGREVAALDREGLRRFRRRAQIIFQDPFSSLNPRMTVGGALREVLKVHGIVGPGRFRDRVAELLEAVGLHADDARKYPHEFSGGQRQRVGIARALAVQPDLVIADEPVSALDVSVKAQILNLLVDLQEEFDLTYLIISHDLSVVRHMADRVAVLYLGRIVELADTETLFRQPQHPYTRALLSAIPEPRPDADRPRILLPGDVPDPADPPDGCPFHPRCPHPDVDHVCETVRPGLERKRGGGLAACHKAESRPDGGRVEQA